jgi:hypothetical protein
MQQKILKPIEIDCEKIIINGGFRSGTTYLWKLMKISNPGIKVFYEPLNPHVKKVIDNPEIYASKWSELHSDYIWGDYDKEISKLIKNFYPEEYTVLPEEDCHENINIYFNSFPRQNHPMIFQTNRLHLLLGKFSENGYKAIHLLRNPYFVYNSYRDGMARYHKNIFKKKLSKIYNKYFNDNPFELNESCAILCRRHTIEVPTTLFERFVAYWVLSNYEVTASEEIVMIENIDDLCSGDLSKKLSDYLKIELDTSTFPYVPKEIDMPSYVRFFEKFEHTVSVLRLDKEYRTLREYL